MVGTQLSHVYPLGSRVTDEGHLELGGCDAVELAREFGTPAYVVVEDDIRARARAFIEAYAARWGRRPLDRAAAAELAGTSADVRAPVLSPPRGAAAVPA